MLLQAQEELRFKTALKFPIRQHLLEERFTAEILLLTVQTSPLIQAPERMELKMAEEQSMQADSSLSRKHIFIIIKLIRKAVQFL